MTRRQWRFLRYIRVAVLMVLILFGVWHVRTQQERRYGLYTARQIFDRAEPLCYLLVPRADRLTLSIEHTPERAHPCAWIVEADDEVGNNVLRLAWDATNGDLWYVSVVSLSSWIPTEGKGMAPTSREAVRAAWSWVSGLGFAEPGTRWRLVCALQRRREGWQIIWKAEGREAVIRVDISAEELIGVRSWQSPMR